MWLKKDNIIAMTCTVDTSDTSLKCGFIGPIWFDKINEDPEGFTECPDSELEEVFMKEVRKRYGEGDEWKTAKLLTCAYNRFLVDRFNSGRYNPSRSVYKGDNRFWSQNGCLFNNGKWAKKQE